MASLLANSVATLFARLAVPVFSFAISVTIARLYGAETLGVYVQIMALTVIFQTMATAGIQLLLTRDIAGDPEETSDHLNRARSFALVSGTAATAVFLAYAFVVLESNQRWGAVLLALTMVPSARMAIQEGFFMATRAHHKMTVVAVVENTLKLVFASAVFLAGSGIVAICAAIGAARLVAVQVGQWLMAGAGEAAKGRFSFTDARTFGRMVAPFAVLLSVSMVYFRMDILMVGFLCDGTETGLYGAAITLYTVLILVLSSVMSAVYPRLSAAFRDSREGFVGATMLSVKLLSVAMVPFAVVTICVADWALVLVFGRAYESAAPVLRLLAASVPLHAVNGVLGQALQAGKQQMSMVPVVTIGLAVHFVGIMFFVPILGIEGAAVSVLISSTLVTIGTFLAFQRNVELVRPGARAAAAASTVILPITVTLLAGPIWRPLIGVLVLVVFGIVAIFGVLSKYERDSVLRVLRPSRDSISQ